MSTPTDSRPTRPSLINGIKDAENRRAWEDFDHTYRRLIHNTAVRAGIPASEADDVVQDTLISVSRNIHKFNTDPAFGSFKNWLFTLTRSRIEDRRRRLGRLPTTFADLQGAVGEAPTATDRTALEHRIPDPAAGPAEHLDQAWEEEWGRSIQERALDALKRQVEQALHFQVFYRLVVHQSPSRAVAKIHGINVARVYLIKHRLLPKYKQLLREAAAAAAQPKVPPRPEQS